MPSKQEQRDEERRLFHEGIVCQNTGHTRKAGERSPKQGEVCPHCEDTVGDPLLARLPALDRPRMCEESGGHEVAPPTWPPTGKHSSSRRDPSLNARCRRCRCNVIVYAPVQEGVLVKVFSPDWSRQIAGEGAGKTREPVKV